MTEKTQDNKGPRAAKSRLRHYLDNALAQMFGRAATLCVHYIVFIMIARKVEADRFGEFVFAMSFVSFFSLLSDFGTTFIFSQKLSERSEGRQRLWANFLFLRVCLSLATIAVAVPVMFLAGGSYSSLLMIGILCIPFVGFRFFEPVFQVFERPWYSSLTMFFYSMIFLALNIPFFFFSASIEAFLTAYLLSNVCYVCYAFYLSWKSIKPDFTLDWHGIRGIVRLSLPLGVSTFFSIIISKADIFMLAYMKPSHDVGVYGSAYRILDLFSNVSAVATMPLLPIFASLAARDLSAVKATYERVAFLAVLVTAPAAVMTPVFSEPLIKLFYGAKYIEAARVLDILIPTSVIIFFLIISTAFCVAIKYTHFAYWSSAFAAALNIVLNYAWIPRHSYIGSAWALLICESVIVLIGLIAVIRREGNFFNVRMWVKLLAANTVLALCVYGISPSIAGVLTGLAAYAALVAVFKLFPEEFLGGLRNAVAKRA